VKEMQRNKLLGLCVMSVLALAMLPSLTTYALPNDRAGAMKFIEVAQEAYEEATMLAELTRSRGGNVTLAESRIGEGGRLLTWAKGNFTAGNYPLAIENAKAAQRRFREGIRALEMEEAEEQEEVGHGILVAISHLSDRISRLRDVVDRLERDTEEEKYIAWVNGNLTEAEDNLAAAKAIIEGGPRNASEAARLVGEANRNIDDACKVLKLIGDHRIAWRVESFTRGLWNQREKVRDEIEKARRKGENVEGLERMLDDARELVDSAKSKLIQGDKKGALAEVKEARDLLHDAFKELKKLQRNKH
jgi:hypothetical protein